MVALGAFNEWDPPHGLVTTWMASPAACATARTARRSDVPPSYQRTQHLRSARHNEALGRPQPRLMAPVVKYCPGLSMPSTHVLRQRDHLHIDGISAGLIFLDSYLAYHGLPQAAALSQVASYRDYAARQRAKTPQGTTEAISSPSSC